MLLRSVTVAVLALAWFGCEDDARDLDHLQVRDGGTAGSGDSGSGASGSGGVSASGSGGTGAPGAGAGPAPAPDDAGSEDAGS
jgi:hypothetical protein